MLHILLLILKIAGFLLLAVLGLIILVLLSVLLVPFRYRLQGSYYGKPEGMFRLTWFLHLLSVRVSYYGELKILVRILGFPVFRENGKEAEETVEEELIPDAEEFIDDMADSYTGNFREEPLLSAQELGGEEPEKPGGKEQKEEAGAPFLRSEEEIPVLPHKDEDRGNIFSRIAAGIQNFFRRVMLFIRNIIAALKKADDWKETVTAFLKDEENRKTYRLIKKQLKKVLRHILPVKLKGNITFGSDEPYITGQVLTWAALLYPLYRDNLVIEPVFDRQVLEGNVSLKGRIRTGTLLMAGIRVLLNKNFRKQLKRFLNRGGM